MVLRPALGHVGQHVVELGLREPGIGADALVLQLDVEIARFEAAGELLGPFDRLVYLAVVEQLRNDAGDAADEPMMPLPYFCSMLKVVRGL